MRQRQNTNLAIMLLKHPPLPRCLWKDFALAIKILTSAVVTKMSSFKSLGWFNFEIMLIKCDRES